MYYYTVICKLYTGYLFVYLIVNLKYDAEVLCTYIIVV